MMRMMRSGLRVIGVALLGGALMASSTAFAQTGTASPANSSQVPQPDPSGVNWKGVGIGAGTIAGNILYVPAKLLYGILGGIGGGAGYALTGGNQQIANTIWRSSLGGDYVLTPDMVSGKRPVHFSGPTQTAQPPGAAFSPSDTTALAASTSPTAALPSGSVANYSNTATGPIDSGAGPLGTGTAVTSEPIGGSRSAPLPAAVSSGGTTAAKTKGAPLSSTSIE